MRKLFTVICFIVTNSIFASQLSSYQEIVNAINTGEVITVVTDFNKCSTQKSVIGRSVPNEIMLVNNFIIFSVNHFTTNSPSFKDRSVNEYTTYVLSNENKLTITSKVISLPNYKVESISTNECDLNTAVKYYSR